jgi:hypothetical protein
MFFRRGRLSAHVRRLGVHVYPRQPPKDFFEPFRVFVIPAGLPRRAVTATRPPIYRWFAFAPLIYSFPCERTARRSLGEPSPTASPIDLCGFDDDA